MNRLDRQCLAFVLIGAAACSSGSRSAVPAADLGGLDLTAGDLAVAHGLAVVDAATSDVAVTGDDLAHLSDLRAEDSASLDLAPNPDLTSSRATALTVLAGALGGPGDVDGSGAAARFKWPGGVAVDSAGNAYVADRGNFTIRKIAPGTSTVTTIAGTAEVVGESDGIGAAALFDYPAGLVSDGSANLYVSDANTNAIRQIALATGLVTTIAGGGNSSGSSDGIGAAAQFSSPWGLALDGTGNLFVADYVNHTIRRLVLATGAVTTLAGAAGQSGSTDASGAAARFSYPRGIASDGAGNLYVADSGNDVIRKIVIATGAVTTVAGTAGLYGSTDGVGAAARFHDPSTISFDGAGNLYVTDIDAIRQVAIATGAVTTVAGDVLTAGNIDATGTAARFNQPDGTASDGNGGLLIVDTLNMTIRRMTISTAAVTTLDGASAAVGNTDGAGTAARFNDPIGIASDGAGNVYVADSGNGAIRKIALASGAVSTMAGSTPGYMDGIGSAAQLFDPSGIASDGAGNLYFADGTVIRQLAIATATVTTLAGQWGADSTLDGTGTAARFRHPYGVASDGAGNLYVTDIVDNVVRQVEIASGKVTTLAGTAGLSGSSDGTGAVARFNYPEGIASDGAGNVFVADTDNYSIRQVVVATGKVTTLAGRANNFGGADGVGSAARFSSPNGIASDGAGHLYVADAKRSTLRKITIATATVSTVVGVDLRAKIEPGPLPAGLNCPTAAVVVGADVAITDSCENVVLLAPAP